MEWSRIITHKTYVSDMGLHVIRTGTYRTFQIFVVFFATDIRQAVTRFDLNHALSRILESGAPNSNARPFRRQIDQVRDAVVTPDLVLEGTADVSALLIHAVFSIFGGHRRLLRRFEAFPPTVYAQFAYVARFRCD